MERIERNEYKYRMAKRYKATYPEIDMFDSDALYYSGELYKLPFISGAGDLADNCYYHAIDGGFELYHMNGFVQLFYREVNGICEVNNEWMPYSYTKVVLEFLRSL